MGLIATLSDRFERKLPDDPGLSIVRRAVRAAIVIPAVFAFVKFVIADAQVTTFVSFGCFALLVIADFGGFRRARATAYLTTTLVGAGLIILGTFASQVAWVGALAMLAVGFWIQFAGIFGGYVAAAQTALQLSFVLAVSVPAPPGAVGARLAGWFIAGAVSTLSGVFFWPRFERLELRSRAAEACRALAQLIRADRHHPESQSVAPFRESAEAAVEAVRRRYDETPKRPAGPTRRDRAYVELLIELERALEFATRPFRLQQSPARPCISEGDRLAAAIVQTLEDSGSVLTGGPPPDLTELDRERIDHREALDRWAGDSLRSGTAPEEILAGLDADHKLRVVSYITLAIGTNAILASGEAMGDALRLPAGTPLEGRGRPVIRIVRSIRTHLVATSSVLHQSLRVGIGLALAVLLARLLRLDHGFWVVLGTLSVLRSNAFGTGRTTIDALAGTVLGFGVGALFTIAVGATSPVLWVAFPITVFFATYASTAISFAIGQASFTVLVILLFNLISPIGWRVGLARIEDVAVGAGVSVFVGILLWPRGAQGDLRAAVASQYRAVAAFLAHSFDRVLARGSAAEAAVDRRLAVRARDRANESFDQFLTEQGARALETEAAAFMVAAGTHAIIAGDLLNVIADMGYRAHESSDGMTLLRAQTQLVLAGFLRLADRLEGNTSALLSNANVSDEVLRLVALSSLKSWRDDPEKGRSAMAVVMAGEWIQQLGELAADLDAPVTKAVQAASTPWWR